MFLTRSLFTLVAMLVVVRGQRRYGAPYKGPPVVPVVLEGGFLADTREVAAAKEYHLNVLAKHAKAVKGEQRSSPYLYQQKSSVQPYIYQNLGKPVYTQAQAYTHSLYQNTQGRSAPQPAPVYEDFSRQSYDDEDDYIDGFSATTFRPDPMVTPRILDNGFIAETPEVDAAKANHFAAVQKAREMVALAQQRAAQEKTARGYSGGGDEAQGYSDGYSLMDRGFSSADYTGYNNYPEYRLDPEYFPSDRTSSLPYSSEDPAEYSNSEKRALVSPSESSSYSSEYVPSQPPKGNSRVPLTSDNTKRYSRGPLSSADPKESASAPVKLKDSKAYVTPPTPSILSRQVKVTSSKSSTLATSAPVASKQTKKANSGRSALVKDPKSLNKDNLSSDFPIRDKVLADAKQAQEKALQEYGARESKFIESRALNSKSQGSNNATLTQSPSYDSDDDEY